MTQNELNEKLLDAVKVNDINEVEKALSLGADVNSADADSWAALMNAAWYGNIDIVRLLVKYGADVNIVDNNGCTVLILACWYGYIDVINLLIEHDVDINIKNNKGQTAFDILKERYPQEYKKLIEEMVIKARKDRLNTEDSLAGPVQDVLPDWNI